VTTVATSLLLHDPSDLWHVAGNVLVLAVLGAVVEPVLGRARLFALFVASGLGGCAMHWLVAPGSETALVGASGGLMGLAAVGAVVRPRAMLGGVVTYVALNVLGLFVATPLVPPGTSVACHVGGFTVGVALVVSAQLRGFDLRRAVAA
jgi:membrane associated rhomboid family serine protease